MVLLSLLPFRWCSCLNQLTGFLSPSLALRQPTFPYFCLCAQPTLTGGILYDPSQRLGRDLALPFPISYASAKRGILNLDLIFRIPIISNLNWAFLPFSFLTNNYRCQ